MAKITGPLMSLDASGSVAGTIVFSKWKGRNYVRQLVVPANPKSVKQTSVRAMMKFLSQQWASLAATPQGTWSALAAASAHSPFNAFTSANMSRWASFLTPTQSYPAANTGTPGTLGVQSATGGVGQLTIAVSLTAVNDNWGLAIFRDLVTGFTPSFSNLIGVLAKTTTPSENYVDTPLAPDTYFYRLLPFTTEGVLGSAFAEITDTVT